MANLTLKNIEISTFSKNLSMLLRSGITLSEACNMIAGDGDENLSKVAKSLAESIENGCSLKDAIKASNVFPDYAVGVIETAEYAGRLDEALDSLADYYERQENLAYRIKNTVTYPVILMLIMTGVLAVLVFAVLPMFERVFEGLTGGLLASSYAYVKVAMVIGAVCLVVSALVLVALLVVLLMMKGKGRQKLEPVLEKFKLTRNASMLLATSKFVNVLATLTASGETQEHAFSKAFELNSHKVLGEKLEKVKAKLEAGESLPKAMFSSSILPSLYGRMLIAGDESGNLVMALEQASDRLALDCEREMNDAIDAVEPCLIGFLTVAVGLTLLGVMLPLLGVIGAV